MIVRQIERILHSSRIDKLILATSLNIDDDILCEVVSKIDSVVIFRGNLENVLDRFYQAAIAYDADTVVRITGDCPITDPEIVDAFKVSTKRAKHFHKSSIPKTWFDSEQGYGESINPVQRVGAYIPGGSAPLPSTVIMTVIPANLHVNALSSTDISLLTTARLTS